MQLREALDNRGQPIHQTRPSPQAWRVARTPSCAFQVQRTPGLRFSATLGQEREVEVRLV
jgi:hypothetical protein